MSTLVAVPTRRGTSNANARGSSEDRRRRRAWLIDTYRADVDAIVVDYPSGDAVVVGVTRDTYDVALRACRCYRCGTLLVDQLGVDGFPAPYTVTIDRRVPGCKGGTYVRDNIRPACGRCNSETGGALRA